MTGKRSGDAKEAGMERTSEEPKAGASTPATEGVELVRARVLLGARGMLRIEHHGEVYTLRITRNDRLILTK